MGLQDEADGFRVEAALQLGFRAAYRCDDYENYVCTEAALIAFAKACERKGLENSLTMWSPYIRERIAEIDAELAPILEAETERFMTAQGYVRGSDEPGKLWVKP